MSFNNNSSNQYIYNSMEDMYSSTNLNGASFSDNLSPEWCYGSLSVREDGLSVSSSVSNTPEIEEKQMFTGVDILYNSATRSPLMDPVVLNTSSFGYTRHENLFEQSMVNPLLEHSGFFAHQKVPSHSFPSTEHLQISYNLHSATSPAPFTHYSFSSNMMPTTQNGYFQQGPLPTLYATSMYPNNNNMMLSNQYQQNHYTNQNRNIPSSQSSDNFSKLPQYDMKTATETTNPAKTPSSIIFKQSLNTQQNTFVCSVPTCSKSFSRPYNLKSHMRTHTHERPYECQYKPCGWKFARPHDLKRHELQHTGQKPHSCRFCQKKFARSDALKRHWKVDLNCAEALQEETRLNGGKEVKYPRRKRSKKSN